MSELLWTNQKTELYNVLENAAETQRFSDSKMRCKIWEGNISLNEFCFNYYFFMLKLTLFLSVVDMS